VEAICSVLDSVQAESIAVPLGAAATRVLLPAERLRELIVAAVAANRRSDHEAAGQALNRIKAEYGMALVFGNRSIIREEVCHAL